MTTATLTPAKRLTRAQAAEVLRQHHAALTGQPDLMRAVEVALSVLTPKSRKPKQSRHVEHLLKQRFAIGVADEPYRGTWAGDENVERANQFRYGMKAGWPSQGSRDRDRAILALATGEVRA